jgi:hypothetical protein
MMHPTISFLTLSQRRLTTSSPLGRCVFRNSSVRGNAGLVRSVVEENQDVITMDKLLKAVSKFRYPLMTNIMNDHLYFVTCRSKV